MCEEYVAWVRDTLTKWPTWLPGDLVVPGDVGYFDDQRRFRKLPHGEQLTVATPVITGLKADGLFSDTGNMEQNTANLEIFGSLQLKLVKRRERAFVLYVRRGQYEELENSSPALAEARERLAAGRWGLRWMIVGQRIKVTDGFALVLTKRNQGASFSIDLGALAALAAGVPTLQGLLNAGMQLAGATEGGQKHVCPKGGTLVFDQAYRVDSGLWKDLYGGKIPNGKATYRSKYSRFSPAEILAMGEGDLFDTAFTVRQM
ncbi:hypothetical protein ACFVHB_35460 [Kitasatospora sp. NPDC127111]|uniref:hypothetical protein n=1 Tax=Kitasatospora sp. NPDC127111 TaxID=3345363 RepID=UPI003642F839